MITCNAKIKSGPNKGKSCTCPKKFGDYCGRHQSYNEDNDNNSTSPVLPDKILPTLSDEMNLDTQDPGNIKFFFESCNREDNDRVNKYREKMIIEMINNPYFYKLFENNHPRYSTLCQNLKREISTYCDEKYDKIVATQIAGRSNSYDLLCEYFKNEDVVCQITVEFKYGVNTITKYPEIYSKYIWAKNSEFNIFKEKSYVSEYKKDVDNGKFIFSFPEEIATELTENKPDWDKYNFNDTKYKHPFQKIIYKYSKESPSDDPYKNFIKNQIKDFLNNTEITDICFEKIQKIILDKQQDKIFLLCCKGSFNSEIINDKIIMKKEVRLSGSGNTLIFPCIEEGYELHWLLRWKNHHGCAGPAWQVSLRQPKK